MKDKVQFLVRVSYLEIYNENIKDLLNPSTLSKTITIREDEKKGILVVGIKEEVVTSFEELMRSLETGALYRTVGSTLMNETSSRSHSIFTITIEQRISLLIRIRITLYREKFVTRFRYSRRIYISKIPSC